MKDNYWKMKPNREKAIMLARRQLSELVCDAVNLEGINFTLPEIQTLLDGVTIGGRKVLDQQIALNQSEAWKTLLGWLDDDDFELSIERACELHAVAAKEETLEWGTFRSGSVTISGTEYMPPSAQELPGLFDRIIVGRRRFSDIYDYAISVFLEMARSQFFYDVNKRMGRFLMNGILIDAGYPVISLSAKYKLDFNRLMLDFYETGKQNPMNAFLRTCLDTRIVMIMQEDVC